MLGVPGTHMQTFTLMALVAPEEPLLLRLGVLALAILFGGYMILVGRVNVRTRKAEESGKRALFLSMLGKSGEMKGGMAVFTGWMRILAGVGAIVFGFVFLFFGAFLKD